MFTIYLKVVHNIFESSTQYFYKPQMKKSNFEELSSLDGCTTSSSPLPHHYGRYRY